MLATFPFFVLLAPLLFLTFLRISLFAAFPHLSHLSLAISGRTHIPFTTSIATSIMPWPSRPRLNCAVTATSCASLRLVFVATAPYRYSGVTHARRGGCRFPLPRSKSRLGQDGSTVSFITVFCILIPLLSFLRRWTAVRY